MAKYVIEIPDEVKWIQYIQQTGHGTINLKVESVSDLTPYTEPDEIKNNKVNSCTSCELYKEHFPECGDVNVLFGDGVGNDNICCCSGYVAKNEDEIRQKAHEEAWELFGVIADMDYDDYEHCFGEDCEDWKFYKLSYQEAKAKYDAWRKQKDEIHVGDELVNHLGRTYVIYDIDRDKQVAHGVDVTRGYPLPQETFPMYERYTPNKTGRHFPEVAELLKKMREE